MKTISALSAIPGVRPFALGSSPASAPSAPEQIARLASTGSAARGLLRADATHASPGSPAQLATQARLATFVQAAGAATGLSVKDSAGSESTAGSGGAASIEDLLARLPEDVRAEVDRFVTGEIASDYYTPENTADRIANFALGGFERFEGGAAAEANTSEARQRYVDFILPAIEKGYGEAIATLGELPDEIHTSLERTRTLISERLSAFVSREPVDVDA